MTKRISDLDPSRSVDPPEAEPRVLTLGSEDAELVFKALGSETSRALFQALIEQPRTASALAEEVDASIQTVSYHLENLQKADLVSESGTHYSDKGREMRVWAAENNGIVVAGDHRDTSMLRERLPSVLGVAVLGVTTHLLVQWLAGVLAPEPRSLEPASNAADPSQWASVVGWLAREAARLDVGLAVFLGGLAVLLWTWRTDPPDR